MNFQEKLQSNYYSSNTYPYVSASEAKSNPTKAAVREKYLADYHRRDTEFKADAFEELGITDNPKAELLYQKAYEIGHGSGYHEIYVQMDDLVDLIK